MLAEEDFKNPHLVKSCCCKERVDINSVKVGLQVFATVFTMFFSAMMIYEGREQCNDTWVGLLSSTVGFWLARR